jgi:plastocyanin
MKRLAMAMMVLVMAVMLTSAPAWAKNPENAFVNFGIPGTSGALNHMIVPDDITISSGGIVNFAIVSGVGPGATGGAGFHQVTVYRVADGTKLSSIAAQIMPGSNYNIVDKNGALVLQVTAGNPLVDSNPSGLRIFIEAAASSTPRTVGVYFEDPGTYLVICNVRPHLDDGMIAIVTVKN